ncbi:MAG TPA: hypothetical protein VGD17_16745 [Chitinophagaceae bacterium]
MKALKLSSLALLCISFFSSCTKDVKTASTYDESQEMYSGAKPGVPTIESSKKPVLTPSQSPKPVDKGNAVTVSYSATDNTTGAAVQCGRIVIYQWLNGAWTEIASGNAPTVSTQPIMTTTADDCAYMFRAGFDPGGNGTQCKGSYAGVDYLTEADFCADVEDPCVDVFTITGQAEAQDLLNGLYEFTITYTLTSPEDLAGVKFQGGATAGGNSGHAITDLGEFQLVNVNNNNTVIKWEGNLEACVPKLLTFKYTRNFSCPANGALVTGDWTATLGLQELGFIAKLPYTCQ